MFAVRLAALVALAVALSAQPKTQDVDGWDKIKWGMTIVQARSIYAIEAQPENSDDWTLLSLHPVKVSNIEMGVQVGARHGSEKITLVRLWSFFGLPASPPLAGPQDFDTLKAMLTGKYGAPGSEETKRGENFRLLKNVLWAFPSTSIALSLEQSASLPNLGNIFLEYTATDTNHH
jgi:hypothetical protein